MATAEVSQPSAKEEPPLTVPVAPVESAWKTPLTSKLSNKEVKENGPEQIVSEPPKCEEQISKDMDSGESDDKGESLKENEKGQAKDAVKPKIFDKKNYVEAPLPKTNPWGKKGSSSG